MTPLELSAMLGLGLASGLHCLQMCGPIVLSYSLPLHSGEAVRAHILYNLGRLITYAALGAAMGAAGGGVGILSRLAGMASGARIVSGAAMIVAGLLMAGFLPSNGLVSIQKHGVTAWFSRAIGKLLLSPQAGGKFRLGLVLGFLPCGLVYAALLKAMESATAWGGALTMLAFGLGTAVALMALGLGASFAGLRLGRWSARLAPVAVVLFGTVLLWRGLTAGPVCHHG
jgi:sulfite exporter TauE/SafE